MNTQNKKNIQKHSERNRLTHTVVSGTLAGATSGLALLCGLALAGDNPETNSWEMVDLLQQADQQAGDSNTSPVRRIQRDAPPPDRSQPGTRPLESQSLDGSGNNIDAQDMGATGTSLLRIANSDYANRVDALAGRNRPSARVISNQVNAQSDDRPNPLGLSDYLWQWGQFIDHDIDLTDGADPAEPADIIVPAGDPWFDPDNTGTQVISFNRSLWQAGTGTNRRNPRQQVNEISAWIDGSNVYGSESHRAQALRTLDGTGQLTTSAGDLLPFNTQGLSNAGGSSDLLFLAGDVRANEQAALTAMHTLFVREHNRLARRIADREPNLDGEAIYQRARRMVIAQIQAITYNEWLPALLGPDALPEYRGYDPQVDGGIANSFSTAAFRLGHSLLSPQLLRLDADLAEIEQGHLSLASAFFSPSRIIDEGGIEPLLRGMAWQECQDLDVFVIDEVRNFLFGAPGSGGFDLASLNIQRGRDHGLPGYNDLRRAYGLNPVRSFNQVSSDPEVRQRLRRVYPSPDQMDAWIGGLAEDQLPGAVVGELVMTIVADQFTRLRDGDRFWYQNVMNPRDQREVDNTTLARVIRRNTDIDNEIPDDVFRIDLGI